MAACCAAPGWHATVHVSPSRAVWQCRHGAISLRQRSFLACFRLWVTVVPTTRRAQGQALSGTATPLLALPPPCSLNAPTLTPPRSAAPAAQQCLGHSESEVRLAAMKAACVFISELESAEDRDKFQATLPALLACIAKALNEGDESAAQVGWGWEGGGG